MLEKFYGAVLPRTGYFCLFDVTVRRHIWAESHEELADLTRRYSDQPGIYFGTASYQSVANRKKPNVRALRALRIDIDVAKPNNPDGSYPNKKAALFALRSFFTDTGLVPTYIITSGKGFHVYWCMDEDCEPPVWEALATGLQQLGGDCGLLIDSTCTIDTARILRPPGTIHHDDVRVGVALDTQRIWKIADLRVLLMSDKVDGMPSVPVGRYDMSINADVQITHIQRPPVSAMAVAGKCAALHHAAATGGNVPEPYWRAMLGLVKHCVEGENLAHEWSSGHPDYDPQETQRKFDGWNAGPTTCAEFANHTKACDTCIYKGTVKSPVLLVEPVLTTVEQPVTPTPAPAPAPAAPLRGLTLPPAPPALTRPWEGRLPEGYSVIPHGDGFQMVYLMPTGEETDSGQPEKVSVEFANTVFWMGHWADSQYDAVASVQVYKLDPETKMVSSFTLPQDVLAIKVELIRFLGGENIQLTNHRKAHMAVHDYARAALQMIAASGKRMQIADHLGLRILPDGALTATQGEYTIFADGHIERSMISPKLEAVAQQFTIPLPHEGVYGEWQPDVWPFIDAKARMYVDFLRKYYGTLGMERFQLAIMMGLASPFMPFVTGEFQAGAVLPRGGLSVSLYSRESAKGKTTAVQAAILAYGLPASLTNDGGSIGSTEKARVSRLTIHGTLPNIMDEMGSATPEAVANAVHMVANGASRERASREGGLNISAPWALINLITTNTSQRDMIANVQESSDAIQRRLLEINMDGMADHDHEARHSFAADWALVNRECVGALGAVIHREICRMGLTAVTSLVMSCVEKADKTTGAKVASRFQYRGLGALLALHLVLSKIGLDLFPLKGVVDAFKVAHNSGQDFIAQNVMPTDELEVLSKMLHDLMPHTLITEGETRRVHGQDHIQDRVLNDRMPDLVLVRHIQSLGKSYVSVDAAREWCRKHRVAENEIVKRARDERIFHTFEGERNLSAGKYNLYKGLQANTKGFIKCYSIDKKLLARKLGLPEDESLTTENAPSNVVPLRQS